MRKLSTIIGIAVLCLMASCVKNEGENHDITLEFMGDKSIEADGKSQTIVEVDFGRVLYTNETVQVYTTAGYLSILPITGEEPLESALSFEPRSDKVRVFITAGLRPEPSVRLSVKLGDWVATNNELEFTTACPDEFKFSMPELVTVSDPTVSVPFQIDLFRDYSIVSNGIRVEFTPEPDSLFQVEPLYTFTDSGTVTASIKAITPDSTGTGLLKVTLIGCSYDSIMIPVKIR